MNGPTSRSRAGDARFEAYLDAIAAVLGHVGRAPPMRAYCRGLLLPGERKSIELVAARLGSNRVQALHQSMHHVVAKAQWDDMAVLAQVRREVLPAIERKGIVRYLSVNNVVYMKQGIHSVGVVKQPYGPSAEQENCQVAVSLWASNEIASLPIAYRLFLPAAWIDDPGRRDVAGVPPDIRFETKATIALRQLRQACSDGVQGSVVLGDAGYGDEANFRAELEALGLRYVLAVSSATDLWRFEEARRPVATSGGKQSQGSRLRPLLKQEAMSAKAMAATLPLRAWRTIKLRVGDRTGLSSRFAAMRVGVRQDDFGGVLGEGKWLLAEWPIDKAEPTQFWLSDLPSHVGLKSLVWTAKSVWRISADCQELKQNIGLGHFEGRGWRGHHHHASLCIAAYGFLVSERCSFPPAQRYAPHQIEALESLPSFRPRGSK